MCLFLFFILLSSVYRFFEAYFQMFPDPIEFFKGSILVNFSCSCVDVCMPFELFQEFEKRLSNFLDRSLGDLPQLISEHGIVLIKPSFFIGDIPQRIFQLDVIFSNKGESLFELMCLLRHFIILFLQFHHIIFQFQYFFFFRITDILDLDDSILENLVWFLQLCNSSLQTSDTLVFHDQYFLHFAVLFW